MRFSHLQKKVSLLPKEKLHYLGHRQRLRMRFLQSDTQNIPDYELLEILLFGILPRQDVKPIAKQLLYTFGNIRNVFHADPQQLQNIPGIGESALIHLKAILEVSCRFLKEDILNKPLLDSMEKVIQYCQARMAYLLIEQFRILFLDKKNQLLADEVQQQGTVDFTPIFPREVIKRALETGASALILVHNHPSGDPTPSEADICITKKLAILAQEFNILLHDHLIIGKMTSVSLKKQGMI